MTVFALVKWLAHRLGKGQDGFDVMLHTGSSDQGTFSDIMELGYMLLQE